MTTQAGVRFIIASAFDVSALSGAVQLGLARFIYLFILFKWLRKFLAVRRFSSTGGS
jgi:hypothetical protein